MSNSNINQKVHMGNLNTIEVGMHLEDKDGFIHRVDFAGKTSVVITNTRTFFMGSVLKSDLLHGYSIASKNMGIQK